MPPTISVIIPTWNSAKTLVAAITSCLNQTLPPLEILVCDDGSSDDSKHVVEAINDARVIWLPATHVGTPAAPRNNGLNKARGTWIAFCDSDDEWLPTKLEKQYKLAEKNGHKAICTNALIKQDGVLTDKKMLSDESDIISFSKLITGNTIICSSAIVHASICTSVGGFPEDQQYASFEDYVFWLRVTTKTPFAYLSEALVIYDDHPNTSIRSKSVPDKELKRRVYSNFIDWAKTQQSPTLFPFMVRVKIYQGYLKIKNMLVRVYR
ncbi:glycosyltransferase family 2 protein [Candidatus Woesebacteria bacterium]|nr:glycosyltransferase family 2 protein [Candidatus Woesebacteria bacterium]